MPERCCTVFLHGGKHETSYTYARDHTLAELWDKAISDCEPVNLEASRTDLALISAAELSSMRETLYLLRSPANAQVLFDALERAERGEGVEMTLAELRREVGLEQA
jgi:antitoxin YefM